MDPIVNSSPERTEIAVHAEVDWSADQAKSERLRRRLNPRKRAVLSTLWDCAENLTLSEISQRSGVGVEEVYSIVSRFLKDGVVVEQVVDAGTPRQRRYFRTGPFGGPSYFRRKTGYNGRRSKRTPSEK